MELKGGVGPQELDLLIDRVNELEGGRAIQGQTIEYINSTIRELSLAVEKLNEQWHPLADLEAPTAESEVLDWAWAWWAVQQGDKSLQKEVSTSEEALEGLWTAVEKLWKRKQLEDVPL